MAPNVKDKSTILVMTETESEKMPLKQGSDYGSLQQTPPSSCKLTSRKSYHRRMESKSSEVSHVLLKTQTTMLGDARTFAEGSIPHSIAIGTIIGIVCGIAAYIYYALLFWLLEFVWHTLPKMVVVDRWPVWAYCLWIPLVGFTMALGVGLTVVFLGEPGDLPSTIKCVHDKAYVAMNHGRLTVEGKLRSTSGNGSNTYIYICFNVILF